MIFLKNLLLDLVDTINQTAEPWKPFTREAKSVETDLKVTAQYYEDQLNNEFCTQNNELIYNTLPTDLGDSCIWQGVYTAFRVLTFKVCNTQETYINAINASNGLSYYIVDPENILVRGVSGKEPDLRVIFDPTKKYTRRYERIYRDDASLDSLAGFLFACAIISKFTPRIWETTLLRPALINFAKTFKENGYRLTNFDKSFTQYGDCRPGLFQGPIRNLAAALVMKLLQEAGIPNDDWKNISKKYGKDFAFTETHFLWKHPWYNDHLAMLCNLGYVLSSKPDEAGYFEAKEGIRRLVDKHNKHGNAFLTFMGNLVGVVSNLKDQKNAKMILTEFKPSVEIPNGKTQANTINSTRKDIPILKWGNNKVTTQPLPIWQRPPADYFWQRCPYILDGNCENLKYNGLDFLIAYQAYLADFLHV